MPGGRAFLVLARNCLLAALLYAALYFTVELAKSPVRRAALSHKLSSLPSSIVQHANGHTSSSSSSPPSSSASSSSSSSSSSSDPTDPKHSTLSSLLSAADLFATNKTIRLNPHANLFNRPTSAVHINDAYLGRRPHVDTVADLDLLVRQCRGSYEAIERSRDVRSCLDFFAHDEHRYYHLPAAKDRAGAQDPRRAEYLDADGEGNTLARYPRASPATRSSRGRCNGPVIPYHVYWTGPATWRVEAFIKSYLSTQNLPCSRLWLWLDADQDPDVVHKFLNTDPLFARFLPLVARGDIVVRPWNFPLRMPLPRGHDHTDGIGYYANPAPFNANDERAVADGIVENVDGEQFIQLKETQMTFFAQAISDAVRFVILHLHGGLYLDMDVWLLRDMRPLLLPARHNFAERWSAFAHPGDFNTAILSLSANSSLSSYLLRGGVRMGLNFHPRVIGRMAWKDKRDQELLMLETAAFDPVWTEFDREREGRCSVPCLKDYHVAFKGVPGAVKDEWQGYDAAPLAPVHDTAASAETSPAHLSASLDGGQQTTIRPKRAVEPVRDAFSAGGTGTGSRTAIDVTLAGDPLGSWSYTAQEEQALRDAGVVLDYVRSEDKYPPNNRTMENFFRGAWTYHVHNQWLRNPEPNSWLDVVLKAHDRFFAGGVNPYGEKWEGPHIPPYNRPSEFV